MQKSNWICTDIDCAQFRREAPEKGSNVFELAQVNALATCIVSLMGLFILIWM